MHSKADDFGRGIGCWLVLATPVGIFYSAVCGFDVLAALLAAGYVLALVLWYRDARERTIKQMRETDRRERDDAEALSPFLRGDR